MKSTKRTALILLILTLLIPLCIWGCGGGGGGGGSSDPDPTETPLADYYDLVMVQSDGSISANIASTNVMSGDFEVAPPNDRDYTMSEFPFNVTIQDYYYGTQVSQASGISNHAFYYPPQIQRNRDFSSGEAPENPTGLFTFVNDGEFKTFTNNFDYPREIKIEYPEESEYIEAGRSFQIKWNSDEGNYRYFVVVEYAELSDDGMISKAWSSDDFRSLNWADPSSIYMFMYNKTTTDKEIYVPAALFTTPGIVNITVYGFLTDKFEWDASTKIGYEVLSLGKKTIRVNITQ